MLAHFTLGATTVLFRIIIQTSSQPEKSLPLAQFKPYFLDEACTKAAINERTTAYVLYGIVTLNFISWSLSTIEILTTELRERHCYVHHLGEETEAQRVYIICPRSHSEVRAGSDKVKSLHCSATH